MNSLIKIDEEYKSWVEKISHFDIVNNGLHILYKDFKIYAAISILLYL